MIDPSGQALKFIQNQFKRSGVKNAQTSFLNSAFMNDLERCVRFGTPLLVEDVERIDPVLNPILNKVRFPPVNLFSFSPFHHQATKFQCLHLTV